VRKRRGAGRAELGQLLLQALDAAFDAPDLFLKRGVAGDAFDRLAHLGVDALLALELALQAL
jgi:hypothetical protein